MNLQGEIAEEGVVYRVYLKKTNRPGRIKVQAPGKAKIKPTVISLNATGLKAMWITRKLRNARIKSGQKNATGEIRALKAKNIRLRTYNTYFCTFKIYECIDIGFRG